MRTDRTGRPLVAPDRFKPTRDRRVRARDVACPSCHAEPQADCVRVSDGEPYPGSGHPRRRSMAVRADNLARGI